MATVHAFLALLILSGCVRVKETPDTNTIDAAADSAADTLDVPIDWEPGDGTDTADTPDEPACAPGLVDCYGACLDILSDHEHCGACGHACEPIEVCADGECRFECPPGSTRCGGSCVNTDSDPRNCGSCGNVCTAGVHADPVCEGGECSVLCHPGYLDTDGDGSCETSCATAPDIPELWGESNHSDITWLGQNPEDTMGDPDERFGYLLLTDFHGGCTVGDWYWGKASWTWDFGVSNTTWTITWRAIHGATLCTNPESHFALEGSADGSTWTPLWQQSFVSGGSGYDSGVMSQAFTGSYRFIKAFIYSAGEDTPGNCLIHVDAIEACR